MLFAYLQHDNHDNNHCSDFNSFWKRLYQQMKLHLHSFPRDKTTQQYNFKHHTLIITLWSDCLSTVISESVSNCLICCLIAWTTAGTKDAGGKSRSSHSTSANTSGEISVSSGNRIKQESVSYVEAMVYLGIPTYSSPDYLQYSEMSL